MNGNRMLIAFKCLYGLNRFFLLQNGVVVIPKSTHEERMQENFNVFDFVLTDEEMKQIEALDTGKSLFFSHYSPETVEWFMSIV